jgi:energy-coupling factor transporter ATP-binding protein EcfA2
MYLIESIELKNFDGMWLNKIESFKMTIEEAITIILGRNGCGKSRLIAMLSPLAPTRFDILADGHKAQVVRLDNVRYELRSVNRNGHIKNTLINLTDNVVLVKDANSAVFNKLIKQLFNYDKDLHDLLTGRVKLTSMSVGDRKKWFSSLSESDLSYALTFYKKTKEHHRDLTGSIKSLQYTIGELRPRVVASEEERNALRTRLQELQQDISALDREIDRCQSNPDVSITNLERVEAKLQHIHNEVMKLDIAVPRSLQALSTRELEQELVAIDAHYQQTLERLEDLQGRLNKAIQVTQIDVGELRMQEQELMRTKQTLDNELGQLLFPDLLQYTLAELSHAEESTGSYIETLVNGLKAFAVDFSVADLQGQYTAKQQEVAVLANQLTQLERREHELTMRLKAYHEAKEVVCDHCNHTFKPGMRQSDVARLQHELSIVANDLAVVREGLKTGESALKQLGELLHVKDRINDVGRYFKSSRPVMSLFSYLSVNDAFSKDPLSYLPSIQRFQTELSAMARRANIDARIERIADEIKLAEATQAEDVDQLKQLETELNQRINDLLSRKHVAKTHLQLFHDVELRQRRAAELEAEHQRYLDEHQRLSDVVVANIKQELLAEHRQQLWDLLITCRQRYDEMERERLRLEDQEQQLATQATRLNAVKHIMESMSPDSGVLAKYLYQCIERITNLMTEYVEQIWGYRMQVLPCDVSDADMDYKFPYWSGDDSRPKADISLGSVGQKEVFDFVFVLAVYRARGLERYPLFLDELGSGFDQGHRASMIDFVKGLLGGGFCSQVFMVSHDPASHFKLANAANVVIDPEGITLPQSYNERVTITYAG